MYNRYIGNTGKFYRVDDEALPLHDARQYPHSAAEKLPAKSNAPGSNQPPHSDIIGALKGVLGNFLPEGMDIGDVLLILILLLLYLEKEDEEILIILSVLLFMGFK